MRLVSVENHGQVRAAIYLFHDPQGRVDDYVLTALRSLRPYVQHILVVSNGVLESVSRDSLTNVADDVLERDNEGFDVGGYQAGLAHLGWESIRELDKLLLLNHTFFAPVRPWAPVFEEAAAHPEAAFWGLTEHAEQRPHPFLARASMPRHLQSHFLAVRRRLLRDPAFREYWETMPPIRSYHDSIAHHESRFTPHFNALGYESCAVFPVEDFQSLNPSLEEPMALLEAGCPALKRRIFFHDPLYLDSRGISGAELLRSAATPELSEDTMLAGLVRTSSPRALLATAGLSEPVRVSVREGAAPAASSAQAGSSDVASPATQVDDEQGLRVFLSLPMGLRPQVMDAVVREVEDRFGGEVMVRLATIDGAGSLMALLHDGADLLNGGGPLLRLSTASVDVLVAAAQENGDLGACASHDLLGHGGAPLETARALFSEHPGLGALGQAAPVRGEAALGHGLSDEQLAADIARLAKELRLTTPWKLASPVWSYGGSMLMRGQALAGLRELDVEQVARQHGARRAEQLLERLEIPAILSAGWHYRQLLGERSAEDYALLEYRYQALAALLPEDPEEAQRYLAARVGENASLGSMLRRELEHRAPVVAQRLTPTYRRLTGALGRIRQTH